MLQKDSPTCPLPVSDDQGSLARDEGQRFSHAGCVLAATLWVPWLFHQRARQGSSPQPPVRVASPATALPVLTHFPLRSQFPRRNKLFLLGDLRHICTPILFSDICLPKLSACVWQEGQRSRQSTYLPSHQLLFLSLSDFSSLCHPWQAGGQPLQPALPSSPGDSALTVCSLSPAPRTFFF